LIAVGDRSGRCLLLDATSLEVKDTYLGKFAKGKKKDAWIEDIKFSPTGEYIAFGTHGGLSPLELVQVTAQKKLKKIASSNLGLTSALTHLDWSQDGEVLMLNSQANELLFVDFNSKKAISASSTKSVEW
jgi:WD40 repeat protein